MRRIQKLARPVAAVGLAGSLAVDVAAPAPVHHEELAEPAVAQQAEAVYPAFTAPPWPAFEPLTYKPFAVEEVRHGPHAHLPHYELIEYRYVEMSAPIISTASGSRWPTMFNLRLGQAI